MIGRLWPRQENLAQIGWGKCSSCAKEMGGAARGMLCMQAQAWASKFEEEN